MKSVTPSALTRRVNRKLAHQCEVLSKTRGERWRGDLGDYYIVNWWTNTVEAQHIDLEALGREIGVLREHEYVCW